MTHSGQQIVLLQDVYSLVPTTRLLTAGEMVLLLHWSMLNYAAVVKILKKHGELPRQCTALSETDTAGRCLFCCHLERMFLKVL